MSKPEANISIPVDLTNPGQFFACCGLLELADRLWPGVEGCFEPRHFCIMAPTCDPERSRRIDETVVCGSLNSSRNLLAELLAEAKALKFDVGDDEESDDADDDNEDNADIQAIELVWRHGGTALLLDWWADKSIKPWAGSMKERVILRAMLEAIDPAKDDPFNDLRRVQYQSPRLDKKGKLKKPQKKEPFYFDPRRGNKAHPLDCGFSPDTHKMEAECCPALESLCFIGLQRARPAATGVANRSRYTVWMRQSPNRPGIPANLVGAIACGAVRLPGSTDYVFDNYFRTDQRKHKTFSQATLERNNNVRNDEHTAHRY